MLIVQKFGGTSVQDRERILRAAGRAVECARQGHQVVVVVSAQGDTTDELIAAAAPFCPGGRELDAYMAAGEQLSSGLMAMAIATLGEKAVSLTGWQAGIVTDSQHTDARIKRISTERIRRELERGNIVVVAGFQGITETGDITTLGRGGSDTTAVALAAWLGADICRIYTDVDGVYDKDPRKHADAVKLPRVSYEKMLALAQNGAQVLHDRCVEIAREHNIVVEVLSSFRPLPGTLVGPWKVL